MTLISNPLLLIWTLLLATLAGAASHAQTGAAGPGFPAGTHYTQGELLSRWNITPGGDGDDGRISVASLHRGWLMLDSRDPDQMLVYDLSDPTQPREVHRFPFLRPFHAFFMLDDLYYNQDQRFVDMSDMLQLAEATTAQTGFVANTTGQNRDFLAYPFLYTGDNGYSADNPPLEIRDIRSDELVGSIDALGETGFQAQPIVIGNLMLAAASHTGEGLATYDISDPSEPVLLDILSEVGGRGYEPAVWGSWLITSHHLKGKHISIVDFSDPSDLKLVTNIDTGIPGNDVRYLNFQDEMMFAGSGQYDLTDFSLVQSFPIVGRQYSLPLGNMIVTTSHDGRVAIFAHQAAPDTRAPFVSYTNPVDGATNQAVTSRVGIVIPETLDPATINPANVIVRSQGGSPIPGMVSWTDKDIITFHPLSDLDANTTYEIHLPADGLRDVSGNGIAEFTSTFTTAGSGAPIPLEITDISSSPRPAEVGSSVSFRIAAHGGSRALEYQWDFGDGSATDFAPGNDSVHHRYASPDRYVAIGRVREVPVSAAGDAESKAVAASIIQIVHNPLTASPPTHSSAIVYDAARDKVWNVNPDNATVTRVDVGSAAVDLEVRVGAEPRSIALRPDGSEVWLSCEGSARIDILDASDGSFVESIDLGYGAGPMGLVFSPDGRRAYVADRQSWQLLSIDPDTRELTHAPLLLDGPPRALAVSGDASTLYAGRFISPNDEGQIWEVDASDLTLVSHIGLANDPGPDTTVSGRGIPNYVLEMAISPDGTTLRVPSKKDNTDRGLFRDGEPLEHDKTVRSIVSSVDLGGAPAEQLDARIDVDNQGMPHGIAYSPVGDVFFVAFQDNNEVLVFNAQDGSQIDGIPMPGQLAPQGLALSDDGGRLFVHNFLSRSVSIYDTGAITSGSGSTAPLVAHVRVVAQESLPADVLRGKQVFYNAEDPRMSSEGYLSCASCHLDGGADGRIWDFTDRGEGLRNTITLRGRSGMAHGPVHWSGNFDEIQDFEHDIRNAFGGTGFLTDAQFESGTTGSPLGDPKAGLSPDLDALSAYVSSLAAFPDSPFRDLDGGATASSVTGRQLFHALDCASCHSGEAFTDSELGVLHDIGTLEPDSGQRLGGALPGIDTPTLRGLHATAPYLHDGSAATLEEVFEERNAPAGSAHAVFRCLEDRGRADLISFLLELDNALDDKIGNGKSARSPHPSRHKGNLGLHYRGRSDKSNRACFVDSRSRGSGRGRPAQTSSSSRRGG